MNRNHENFIKSIIWASSFKASFSRNSIYKNNPLTSDKSKLKSSIREYIEKFILTKYRNDVISEKEHIQNIKSISKFSREYDKILEGGELNFGTSQKLLNLLLKCHWTILDDYSEPPHFPVDRLIQNEIIKLARNKKIKPLKVVAWSKMDNENDYLKIMKFVKDHLLRKNESLANFELELYQKIIAN